MALDISAAKVVKILHVCKFFWILDMGYWILVRIKKRARYHIELFFHYEKHYLLNNTITCALRCTCSKIFLQKLCQTFKN